MAPQLNCFLCNYLIPGGLKGLSQHFRSEHGITITEGIPGTGFICAQDGCQKNYDYFTSLSRHIKKNHLKNLHNLLVDETVSTHEELEMPHFLENEDITDYVNEQNFQPEAPINQDLDNLGGTDDGLKTCIIRMLGKLQCNPSLTGSMTTSFCQEVEEMLFYLRSHLKTEILSRLRIDPCNKLWVLDSGVVNGVHVCPAQLLTFDLDTDKLIGKLTIPNEIARDPITKKGLLVTPIIDNDGPYCANTTVYIADEEGNGLLVWNSVRLFRLKSRVFEPAEKDANFTIAGTSFHAWKGISALALSPRIFPDTGRFLTFGPLASRSIYFSASRVIKRSTFGDKIRFYKGLDVLPSQTPAMAFSSEGTLFYGLTREMAIGCWNRYNPLDREYFKIIAVDKERLQYASGIKVIPKITMKSPEELWVLTNKMQDMLRGEGNYNRINFRILKSSITELITGTDCEMPAPAKQMLEEILNKQEELKSEAEAIIWEVSEKNIRGHPTPSKYF